MCMKKKAINYSDLSKKQLQYLKDIYVKKKVEEMNNKDLKNFVLEILNHQIHDTIGKEEELEAWDEISSFFGEQFESLVEEIKQKYVENESSNNFEDDDHKKRLEILEKNKIGSDKEDMWND